MSRTAPAERHSASRPRPPQPRFDVLAAEPEASATTPMLAFTVRATESEGREVHAMALTVAVAIDPARWCHDREARARVVDLFGPVGRRITETTRLPWGQTAVRVSGFRHQRRFDVRIICDDDAACPATRFLESLSEGSAPLSFRFYGKVLYELEGQPWFTPLPWISSARYGLPVDVWRRAIDGYYAGGEAVRLRAETLELLRQSKSQLELATLDEAVGDLLRKAGR